jgi:hypothetical protein
LHVATWHAVVDEYTAQALLAALHAPVVPQVLGLWGAQVFGAPCLHVPVPSQALVMSWLLLHDVPHTIPPGG